MGNKACFKIDYSVRGDCDNSDLASTNCIQTNYHYRLLVADVLRLVACNKSASQTRNARHSDVSLEFLQNRLQHDNQA